MVIPAKATSSTLNTLLSKLKARQTSVNVSASLYGLLGMCFKRPITATAASTGASAGTAGSDSSTFSVTSWGSLGIGSGSGSVAATGTASSPGVSITI